MVTVGFIFGRPETKIRDGSLQRCHAPVQRFRDRCRDGCAIANGAVTPVSFSDMRCLERGPSPPRVAVCMRCLVRARPPASWSMRARRRRRQRTPRSLSSLRARQISSGFKTSFGDENRRGSQVWAAMTCSGKLLNRLSKFRRRGIGTGVCWSNRSNGRDDEVAGIREHLALAGVARCDGVVGGGAARRGRYRRRRRHPYDTDGDAT